MAGIGSSNLIKMMGTNMSTQNTVFKAIKLDDTMPLIGAGKKCSIYDNLQIPY